jgi:hypothetical protein
MRIKLKGYNDINRVYELDNFRFIRTNSNETIGYTLNDTYDNTPEHIKLILDLVRWN